MIASFCSPANKKKMKKLESFHCRLKALGAKCRLGTAEEDLIKDIFIAFMTNIEIQRELLMETRTAQQVLQFALNRERGQENHRAINTQLNRNPLNPLYQISHITPNQRNQAYKQTPRPRIPTRNFQPPRNTTIPNPCRRYGIQLTQEHLQICPAKKVQCNLCKKIGHYSKMCRSAKFLLQTQQITPQQSIPQTRRVRNIRATTQNQPSPIQFQDTQSDNNEETVDLENTFFIQEVFDGWTTVNFNKPKTFNKEQPSKYSPNLSDKILIRTTSYRTEIDWLADTGSPRSFIGKEKAEKILQQCRSAEWKDPNECPVKYRCFNNIEIPTTGAIQLKLRSG